LSVIMAQGLRILLILLAFLFFRMGLFRKIPFLKGGWDWRPQMSIEDGEYSGAPPGREAKWR